MSKKISNGKSIMNPQPKVHSIEELIALYESGELQEELQEEELQEDLQEEELQEEELQEEDPEKENWFRDGWEDEQKVPIIHEQAAKRYIEQDIRVLLEERGVILNTEGYNSLAEHIFENHLDKSEPLTKENASNAFKEWREINYPDNSQ